MAFVITSTAPINDTDAHFQAWAQMLYNAIVTTMGWTVTADTGQLGATVVAAHPTLASTVVGYWIFKPSGDTADATVPIRIKLEVGSGAAANNPSIWITVATGSDGLGNLNGGQVSTRKQWTIGATSTTSFNSYFAGDGTKGRLTFALWPTSNLSTTCPVLVIDRIPDSSGNPSTSGYSLLWWNAASAMYAKHWQNNSGAITASVDDTVYTSGWGSSAITTGVIGSFAQVYPCFPPIGYMANPLLGVLAMYKADIGQLQSFSLTVYGASHTFMSIRSTNGMEAGGNPGSTLCSCLLWE